jgi:hypothetical protein
MQGGEMGDGIVHSQLVATNLALMQQPGAVVILDIAKAFDRSFLVSVIRRCGGSLGMCAWVELLLGNTVAAAVVRVRAAVTQCCWYAGFRQGCPLSPLPYLLVAEASARWLRADTALGISLASHRLVSAHHADDTKVYVPDLQEDTVKHLLERTFLFGQASGQYVIVIVITNQDST